MARAGEKEETLGGSPTVVSGGGWQADSVSHLAKVAPEARGVAALSRAGQRYDRSETLGEGGMGTVYVCRDHNVGRDVAMKVVKQSVLERPDLMARFEREVRLQGQLEHPSIVPIYDLGVDENGTPFFTMKKVAGHTLEDIVLGLARGDDTFKRRYRRHKLLTIFNQVCLAMACAHSRGVVHRDLKPENIIVGQFGAVYVLDWGVAKVIHDPTTGSRPSRTDASYEPQIGDELNTSVGTVIGTPGFMSPEQLRGAVDEINASTDVYALGAILFELLSLQSLHPRADMHDAMNSTMVGADARASVRAPARGIAKELDNICVRATAMQRSDRYPSAMELYAAVEGYLETERADEHRLEMARRRVVSAEAALGRARLGQPEESLKAIRDLNAAVALDPGNRRAMQLLLAAFQEAPRAVPASAELALNRAVAKGHAAGAKRTSFAYLGLVAVIAAALAMGVESWLAVGCLFASAVGAGVCFWFVGRVPRLSRGLLVTEMAAASLANGILGVMFGPLVVVPAMAVSILLVVVVHSRANATMRAVLIIMAMASVVAPVVLQSVGVLPASYAFVEGQLVIKPWAFNFPPGITLAVMLGAGLLAIAVPALLIGQALDDLHLAERRLFAQAWFFRQLAPDEVRAATPIRVGSGPDPLPVEAPPPRGGT